MAGKDLEGEVWDKSSSCQQIVEVFPVVWKQPRCVLPGQMSEQTFLSVLPVSYRLMACTLFVGVGIFSFARYGKDFYTSKYEGSLKTPQLTSSSDYSIFDNYYIPEFTSVLLLRSCKTLTHEIGHILGLRHCQWLACLMQGSNHLEESDRRPLNVCPICLRKLQSAIGFNIVERYKALVKWIDDESCDESGATPKSSSEHVNLPKPVEAFKDWREWIIRCIAVLEK